MSDTWKTILFSRLARLSDPSGKFTDRGSYRALRISLKKSPIGPNDRVFIKLDLRVNEQDRAAIGVTLSLSNWNWMLDVLEAKENVTAMLEREAGSLYVTRSEHNDILVYTEESCKIFGLALSSGEAEELLSYRQAFSQLFNFFRNVNESQLKEITLAVYAYTLYEGGLDLLKNRCEACKVAEDLLEILQRKHSCIKACAREEDFPMDTFLILANISSANLATEEKLIRLQQILNIPETLILAIRQRYLPGLMDISSLRERVLAVHSKTEKVGALVHIIAQRYDPDSGFSTFFGKKRRRSNVQY